MSNTQRVEEVEKKIDQYTKERDSVREQYDERYLNKCQIVAYILKTAGTCRSCKAGRIE